MGQLGWQYLCSLKQISTMASKSGIFFMSGTSKQFEWVYNRYQEALQAKADSKNSKSEVLLKLDKWYQNELPKKIKSRGKESHLTHEELVQLIKWKLARGKFYPQLTNLVRINTPGAVQTESRKAFRKLPNVDASITTLCGLKGVGTTLASAVLAAMAPELAPFMADELLLSMPEVEGLDYTMKEYMKLVEKTKECVDRLNAQGGEWTPHKVEMAVWTYYVLREFKPEVLDDLPEANAASEKRLSGIGAAVTTDTENGLNGEVSNGLETESVSDPAAEAKTEANHIDTSPPSITEIEPKVTESNGSEPPPSEPTLKEAEPEPTHTESEQAPVENGNGVAHQTSAETVKRPLETDSAGDNSSDGLAEPECKRVCSEQPTEPEKTSPEAPETATALAGNGDSMTPAAETPNGVNNTPHPITSGGD